LNFPVAELGGLRWRSYDIEVTVVAIAGFPAIGRLGALCLGWQQPDKNDGTGSLGGGEFVEQAHSFAD
jgi:hypothetical protein